MRSIYAIYTPLGEMNAVEEEGKVVRLFLPGFTPPAPEGRPQTRLALELAEYFAGRRKSFDVPLAFKGPAFFMRAWQAALAIPYGQTATYTELASEAGNPKASRAAGRAMAANPLPILIPCHRVIYAHGTQQQYQGGVEMKEFLLDLEKSSSN
jgi:methylated-DNA-[protein]-cysteine S-methyltransferase